MNLCAVIGCLNTSKNCSSSFFKFPSDINRARIWLIACHREDLFTKVDNIHNLSYRVCADHFPSNTFANNSKNRLRRNVNPSIFPSLEGSSKQSENRCSMNIGDQEKNKQFESAENTNKSDLTVDVGIQATGHSCQISPSNISLAESLLSPSTDQAVQTTSSLSDFLLGFYEIFDKLKLLNSMSKNITNTIRCINGWKITIKAFLKLAEIAKSEGIEYLLTRRFNQDCLENFFGSIRQQNGNCFNPTPIQFIRSFRKLFCTKIMHSGTENCEEDEASILLKIVDMSELKNVDILSDELDKEHVENIIRPSDYRHDNLEKNFTTYVCGYLIKKCLSRHSCETCEMFANASNELHDTSIFIYEKALKKSEENLFGNLYMPHGSFIQFITEMEVTFQKHFEKICTDGHIVRKLVIHFKKNSFLHPCKNFDYNYIYHLYARLRIYYSIKFANRNFKLPNRDRKLIVWRHV